MLIGLVLLLVIISGVDFAHSETELDVIEKIHISCPYHSNFTES